MSATRPKLNLLHILENVAAAGGCASQAWAPHFELGFRVMESGRNQDGQGQNLVVLEGPVDLLDVGKDNFWVESPGADHLVHVVPRYEVRDSR